MIKMRLILLSLLLIYQCGYFTYANLTLNYSNNFISYTHFNPGADLHKNMVLLSHHWNNIGLSNADIFGTSGTSNQLPPFFTDPPLIYPSPLRFSEGGTLGYGLSRDDMTLDFRVYDLFGYQILQKEFKPNENGGFKGYNRVDLNQAFFNQKTLPTGVYFFVFLHNDEFLGKGKFAVVP